MKAYHRLAGNRSLRTITLISTLFSTLWCLAAGIALIKAHTDSSNTAGLNNFFLGVGCAYLVVSGLEGFGFGACFTRRLPLIKVFVLTTTTAAIIVTVTELTRVIFHFVAKAAIQSSCAADQMAENNGSASDFTLAQAQSYCSTSWTNGIYYRIGYLILTTLLALIFASLAASYLHQLQHPELVRQNVNNTGNRAQPSYNYPLAPYPSNPVYDSAPPYQPPPPGFPIDEPKGTMSSTEEKEYAQHNEQRGYDTGFGESTETVTLEPRDGRLGEGRV